jgi:pimeloyl-ACP methyl ester carboxylesterase
MHNALQPQPTKVPIMAFANAPGARLHYESTGSGTPIVFVHETCADLRSWESQVRWFSRRHRCITYNARGYAPSERGAHPESHDHLRLAEDIGAVMDAAGVDKAFVVGHSMGAYVAAHFAVAHPQRLLGLVLCGLGSGSDDPQVFKAGSLAMAATLRQQGMAPFVEQMSRAGTRIQYQSKDPRGFAEFLQHLREMDPQSLANVLEHCHSRRPPIYELEPQLGRLKVPTLIAVGDEDTPCLEPALFLKRTITSAGMWICPRTGHAVNLEEPAQFNAELQSFIQAVQQGRWGERDPRSSGIQVYDAAPKG